MPLAFAWARSSSRVGGFGVADFVAVADTSFAAVAVAVLAAAAGFVAATFAAACFDAATADFVAATASSRACPSDDVVDGALRFTTDSRSCATSFAFLRTSFVLALAAFRAFLTAFSAASMASFAASSSFFSMFFDALLADFFVAAGVDFSTSSQP